MVDIGYLWKPEAPAQPGSLQVRLCADKTLPLGPEDLRLIDDEWTAQKLRDPRIYNGSLATLVEGSGTSFTYAPTDFKTYLAVQNDQGRLSSSLRERLHAGVIAAVVRFSDGPVLVHRRSAKVSHCADVLDSSTAGFAMVERHTLDFERTLERALARELGLRNGEIRSVSQTAAHITDHPESTATFDYAVEAAIPSKELERRVDWGYFSECHLVEPSKLPEFIIKHYCDDGDLLSEGCAALLASLPHRAFLKTIEQLRERHVKIAFGSVKDGLFIPAENASLSRA